jgi:hypothetical protein
MKKILLIETIPDGLMSIKPYLIDINAECEVYPSVKDAMQSGGEPDLVLLQVSRDSEKYEEDIDTLTNDPLFTKVPRISLLPVGLSGMVSLRKETEGEVTLPLPVEKLKFLSLLASVLKIPHRRVFQILINIQMEDSKIKYSGLSLDFSETGMAFECTTDLPEGKDILISFVNPRNRHRFVVKVEIVRKKANYSGTHIFYGVKFLRMTAQDRKALKDFIIGQ